MNTNSKEIFITESCFHYLITDDEYEKLRLNGYIDNGDNMNKSWDEMINLLELS